MFSTVLHIILFRKMQNICEYVWHYVRNKFNVVFSINVNTEIIVIPIILITIYLFSYLINS